MGSATTAGSRHASRATENDGLPPFRHTPGARRSTLELRRLFNVLSRALQVPVEAQGLTRQVLRDEDDLSGVMGEVLDDVADDLDQGDLVALDRHALQQPVFRQRAQNRGGRDFRFVTANGEIGRASCRERV